jgi:hypothetical protein
LTTAVRKVEKPERFTQRYQELLEHHGLEASHSQAGRAHENVDVEPIHHRFKQAVEQELLLRGSRDLDGVDQY